MGRIFDGGYGGGGGGVWNILNDDPVRYRLERCNKRPKKKYESEAHTTYNTFEKPMNLRRGLGTWAPVYHCTTRIAHFKTIARSLVFLKLC